MQSFLIKYSLVVIWPQTKQELDAAEEGERGGCHRKQETTRPQLTGLAASSLHITSCEGSSSAMGLMTILKHKA